MGNGIIGYIKRLWYTAKYGAELFVEWQYAKLWARQYRPGWLQIVNKSRCEEVRLHYKHKILMEYREDMGARWESQE